MRSMIATTCTTSEAEFPGSFDRQKRLPPVVNDVHRRRRLSFPVEPVPRYSACVPWPSLLCGRGTPAARGRWRRGGGQDAAGCDRVGADRHAAMAWKSTPARSPSSPSLTGAGLRVQRDLLAVEVVAGLLARSEREFSDFSGAGGRARSDGRGSDGGDYFWIVFGPMTRKS